MYWFTLATYNSGTWEVTAAFHPLRTPVHADVDENGLGYLPTFFLRKIETRVTVNYGLVLFVVLSVTGLRILCIYIFVTCTRIILNWFLH